MVAVKEQESRVGKFIVLVEFEVALAGADKFILRAPARTQSALFPEHTNLPGVRRRPAHAATALA